MRRLRGFLLLAFALLAAGGLRGEIQVTARFEPSVVPAGGTGGYVIEMTATGASVDALANFNLPSLPSVPGLTLDFVGPRQQLNILNGRTSLDFSLVYRVTVGRPGEYTVPAFTFPAGREKVSVPAATLRVDEPREGDGELREAWIEIQLPRDKVYVGEALPTDVQLFLNRRKLLQVSLEAEQPEKVGDAFAVGAFGRPSEVSLQREGVPFTMANWEVLLTPLKTGPHRLAFELPLVVARAGASRGMDPFESFFGPSPFGRMLNRERLRAFSEDREVQVLPLPEEGRPADFSGGIGAFSLQSVEVSPAEVKMGEPVTVRIRVEGGGNFERLEAPVPQNTDGWRTYAPEATFEPEGPLGYFGLKTFTYTLIPRSEEVSATPEFSLAYFDPEVGEYRSLAVGPKAVKVAPAPAGAQSPPKREATNPVEARRGPELLPPRSAPGRASRVLTPVWSAPGFWVAQVFAGIAFAGLLVHLRHRARLAGDPDFARRRRARRSSRRYLAAARSQASAGDADGFLESACRAIQECVGPFRSGEPASFTREEVVRTLEDREVPEATRREASALFLAAERARFGGQSAAAEDLVGAFARLQEVCRAVIDPPRAPRRSPPPVALLALGLFLVGGLSPSAEAASPAFEEGLASFAEGDFTKAVEAFATAVREHPSAAARFNLANACYRVGDYARAVLNYERVLAQNPRDADAAANLALAREAAGVASPGDPPFDFLAAFLPERDWAWVASGAFWGGLVLLLVAPLLGWRGFWRNLGLLVAVATLLTSGLALYSWSLLRDRAVVTAPDATLLLAPATSSPAEGPVPPAETVRLEESHGEFRRVLLPDGRRGWMAVDDLAPVWGPDEASGSGP